MEEWANVAKHGPEMFKAIHEGLLGMVASGVPRLEACGLRVLGCAPAPHRSRCSYYSNMFLLLL
eukprot:853071-Prorocentrum_minimum.AAC.1